MKRVNLKFKAKIIFTISSLLMFLAVAILVEVYFGVNAMVERNVSQQIQSSSKSGYRLLDERYPGEWQTDGDKLLKGTKIINDDNELVDAIKSDTDSISTIFLFDTRIATNVMKDGKRATGTKMSEQVANTVIKQGEIYEGDAIVTNRLYQTKYTPIKDSNGKTIGAFFVGVEKGSVAAQVNKIIISIATFSIVAILLGIIISVLLVRSISKNIARIHSSLTKISSGDLTNTCEVTSNDEIKEIADGLNSTIQNIKNMIMNVQSEAENIEVVVRCVSENVNALNSGLEDVSASTEELSAGMEETAASAEEMTATAQEIEKTVESLAESAQSGALEVLKINNRASETKEMVNVAKRPSTFS